MKLVVVMPTTVCCEQSFSVTKHTLHANIGMKTAVAKVIVKIHEGTEWMHFDKRDNVFPAASSMTRRIPDPALYNQTEDSVPPCMFKPPPETR